MISYFLPHKNGSNQSHLVEAGLEMLLRPGDDSPKFADLPGPGPGELPGQIVSWGNSESLAYLPEKQDWFEIPADSERNLPKGRYWIGTLKGAKPLPDNFARNTMIGGEVRMILGDGQYWEIPNSNLFPMKFGLGDNGEMKKVPRDDYKHIFQRTTWALDLLIKSIENDQPVDEAEAVEYCVEILSMNYRLNREIVLWLGLLEPTLLTQFMAYTTEVDRITEIYEEVKKKATP